MIVGQEIGLILQWIFEDYLAPHLTNQNFGYRFSENLQNFDFWGFLRDLAGFERFGGARRHQEFFKG